MWRCLALVVLLVTSCAPVTVAPVCSPSADDRAWIDRALEGWRFASREIIGITRLPRVEGIIFDADCLWRSENALTAHTNDAVTWTASRHGGEVVLPDGNRMPAGVTSFASGEDDSYYFVMSTPSVWQAAGVGRDDDLGTLMVAVLIHEASHIAQIPVYGSRLGALIERNSLPDSFNDDSVQERFKENAEFAASVKRETELFLEAARARDDGEAKRLVREGLRMLRERQARWMVGADAYLVEAEDIWLTFEGAGQWAAYQWFIHPDGGRVPADVGMARFTRGRQWSQTEGFAVVLALERLAGPEWKRHAFGDGAFTVLEMLDRAAASS